MIVELLNKTHDQILLGVDVKVASDPLADYLRELRISGDELRRREIVKPACDAHPVSQIFLEEPYTRRAKEKPRGYAGDAVMLDLLYSRTPPADTTSRGRQVFDYTTSSPAGLGVCWRAQYLATEIDRISTGMRGGRILSLACGRLREAEHSKSLLDGSVEVVYAVDQDDESLAVVRKDYGHLRIEAINSSVGGLMKGTQVLSNLHLSYAAGLYDYLAEPIAQSLTAKLFSMLAPGGKLINPNFLTTNHGRGYMESFMDWHLIVRDRAQIESLAAAVPASEIAEQRYLEDPFGVVGYLELVKRS